MKHVDIMIVGSGIIGATMALLLARQPSLSIGVLEAVAPMIDVNPKEDEARVSALSLASKRILERIDVWPTLAEKCVSPYKKMRVWDADSSGEIEFTSEKTHEHALGYIVQDRLLRSLLIEKFKSYENIDYIYPYSLKTLLSTPEKIILKCADDTSFSANCLIAADGAHSKVRELLYIPLNQQSYEHTAIVATVKTEKTHHQTAYQRFTQEGPLAFLPLKDAHTSSIVWSVPPHRANTLLKLNNEAFSDALNQSFNFTLGKILSVSSREAFPLTMRHAKTYVKDRIALIGDAAHTIHPLAGQGVNLGLLDAASLSQVIMDAISQHKDFASFKTLRQYERWRKGDTVVMLSFVGLIKKLFQSESSFIRNIRAFGLNFTNTHDKLKNCFVQYALGNRSDLPTIARSISHHSTG